MVAYLNSRPSSFDSRPLFIYVSGAFLTREKLTRETRPLISKGGLDSSEHDEIHAILKFAAGYGF